MGGGGAGFAFTIYDDMNHGQSAPSDTYGNPCLYNPDEPIDLLLQTLSSLREEDESSRS